MSDSRSEDGLECSAPECDSVLAKSATHYKMNHRRRGEAAIFNQERFDNSTVSERRGSQQDCASLRRCLTTLGFEVQSHQDLTLSEIQNTLQELSERNHKDSDCVVVVFMSHGLEGKLRARDRVFDVNILWECFSAEKSPSLINKPKLFFIQACQGHGRQEGVAVAGPALEAAPEDRVKLVPTYILPDHADFLVAMSTMPGFVSWRSPENGSWYIQTLCQHLEKHAYSQDILTLLTHVSREVALHYTYRESPSSPAKKQMPQIISTLIRVLRFSRSGGRCGSTKRSRSQVSAEQRGEENNDEDGRKKRRRRRESRSSRGRISRGRNLRKRRRKRMNTS